MTLDFFNKLPEYKYWQLYEQIMERIPLLEFPEGQSRCQRMLKRLRQTKHWEVFNRIMRKAA